MIASPFTPTPRSRVVYRSGVNPLVLPISKAAPLCEAKADHGGVMLSLDFTEEKRFDMKVQDPEFVFAITQAQREAAARLRVDADEKNGLETPAWIKRLAQKVDEAKNDASSRDSWKSNAKKAGKKIGIATKKTADVVLDLWASSS